ncbi:unnamed protein product [Moneuplotes crassus]|uniref:Cytochrome P450 n=1 Tax=Euplotes crassus TaxID=5936 RepID=A0AAD1UES9_EUPCR|nr:unnamed protein product [Moneuplotes crassus]
MVSLVTGLLSSTLWYTLYCILGILAYAVIVLIIKPYLVYRRFKRFPNVYTSPSFRPLIGDVLDAIRDMKSDRAHYHNRRVIADDLQNYDMRLRYEGTEPVLLMVSSEAIEEFIKLTPMKIDRYNSNKGLSKLAGNTLSMIRSKKEYVGRRKLLMNELSLNSSSKYTPIMIDHTLSLIDEFQDGKQINLTPKFAELTHRIFTTILFGKVCDDLVNDKIPYEHPDGRIEYLHIRDALLNLSKAYYMHLLHPLTNMFRFVSDYKLLNPFKRDHKNLTNYEDAMRKIFYKAKGPDSICGRILSNTDFSENDKFFDIMMLIFGGTETSSHGILSSLYFLKKHPETHTKLVKELQDNGVTKEFILSQKDSESGRKFLDIIQDCDYLNCCIKEVLRIDSPTVEVFHYSALDDITIRDVQIPKGTIMRTEIHSVHYMEKYWKDPSVFKPERHNPDSDFFNQSKTEGKPYNHFIKGSFGHGTRTCPGQTFAMIELKVILAVLLTFMDYEIDEESITQEGVGFAIGSACILAPKIMLK